MSVFKEGYHVVNMIHKCSCQIFPDAADYGVLTTKGDNLWNWVKQAINWYGVKGSRRQSNYRTGVTVSHDIKLIREHGSGVDDYFRITYTSTNLKPYNGYFQVEQIDLPTPYERAAYEQAANQ